MRVRTHDTGDFFGHPAKRVNIIPRHAELHRIADWRSVFQAQHTHSGVGQPIPPRGTVVGKVLLETLLEFLARRHVARHHHELGEIVVEQLLIERQIKPRAPIANVTDKIDDIGFHFGIVEQELLDFPRLRFGRFQRSPLR